MDKQDKNEGEEIFEGQVMLAEDVTQVGNILNPQQKRYALSEQGTKSQSKDGDSYSSPGRNTQVWMDEQQYQQQKEEEQQQVLKNKSKSQLVKKEQSQEPEINQKSQSQIKPKK